MLEKLGTQGYFTVTKPDWEVIHAVKAIAAERPPIVAEIGVGIGATTLRLAEVTQNRGELHIFDFQENVEQLTADLADRGFTNIIAHGNSQASWDSYHWSLAQMISGGAALESFDLVYIDGSHAYLHDALAFFLVDRLLKLGGLVMFDDYDWRYANSRYLAKNRDSIMTREQAETKQVKMIVDDLVMTHIGYDVDIPQKSFRKIARTAKIAT